MSNFKKVLSFASWSGASGLLLVEDDVGAVGVVGATGAVGSVAVASVLNTCISFYLLVCRVCRTLAVQIRRATALSWRGGRAAVGGHLGRTGFAAGRKNPGHCAANRVDCRRWPR